MSDAKRAVITAIEDIAAAVAGKAGTAIIGTGD
jgi:carbamate kinase